MTTQEFRTINTLSGMAARAINGGSQSAAESPIKSISQVGIQTLETGQSNATAAAAESLGVIGVSAAERSLGIVTYAVLNSLTVLMRLALEKYAPDVLKAVTIALAELFMASIKDNFRGISADDLISIILSGSENKVALQDDEVAMAVAGSLWRIAAGGRASGRSDIEERAASALMSMRQSVGDGVVRKSYEQTQSELNLSKNSFLSAYLNQVGTEFWNVD